MKKIFCLFILHFSFFTFHSSAQNQHKIDSLQNELKKFELLKKKFGSKVTPLMDTTKSNILYEIVSLYYSISVDSALFYAEQCRSLSERIGYKKGIGNAYNGLGAVNLFKENNTRSLEYFQKSLKIRKEIGDKIGIAMSYNNMGVVYQKQGKYPEALKNQLAGLKVREEIGDKKNIIMADNNIAWLYSDMGNYSEALKYQIKTLKLKEETGDKGEIAITYGSIAEAYEKMGNYPEALKNVQKALELSKELGEKWHISLSYRRIGYIYNSLGDYSKALTNEFAAIKAGKEIDDKDLIGNGFLSVGRTYSKQNNYTDAVKNYLNAIKYFEELGNQGRGVLADSYIEIGEVYENKGNLREALSYESKGLSLFLKSGQKDKIKDAYKNLSEINAKLKNYKAAYDNEVLFKQVYDSIYNKENEKKLTSLQMQYDFDKKEQADSIQHASENRINLLNLHKQKEYTGLGIAGFVLVVLLLFLVYRNYNNQRKATAEMAIARQRAEQSEKFKEQFLANMSHEIRTPMNAVMGMTSLVLDSPLNEKQRFYLEGIRKSSDTLLHIINDILDLSKIEAGKMEMENIDFSLADVLDQVKQTLQHKAEEKGLQLFVDVDSSVPDVLIGDPVKLNQVLMNLAGNAIKFTEKGSVTISVTRQASRVTSLETLTFSIIDTGIGIPQDKLQSVFESFTQAKTSDSRRFGGTGLGLTISKQLVELMDGKISIESKEGLGTTFSFEVNFPVGSVERLNAQKSGEEIDGSILDGLRILLADDNEYNRIVACDTLKSNALIDITEAVNGQEVIDLLRQQDFDVVLMDVQMPVMDGYEATRFIREKFATPKNQTQIIALTASVIRADLEKCRAAGMNDYVPKPFNVSQLIFAIAKATGREIKFSAHYNMKNQI